MEAKEGADERFVKELKRIIEEHIDDHEFTVEDICREVALSRSQLYRRIKAATGLSLSLFVRKLRLQKGSELLENTPLTIAEVSYRCGISSPQNFTRYFTAEFGCTPSEYRKRKRAQSEESLEQVPEKIPTDPAPQDTVDLPTPSPIATSRKILPGQVVLLLAITIVLITGLIAFFWQPEKKPKADGNEQVVSVAVIPFKNYSDVSDDFLGNGVVEDVLTHLTKFKNLRVISRTSSERYRDSEKSIPQIGEELGAQYVLEGSIRQADGKIRVTAQLIEAALDSHVWARNYDRPTGNVMDIQGEIALDIARSLDQEIKPAVEESITSLPTENAEAYQALLRGRHLLRTRQKDAMESSIEEFDRALALDPYFSEAYAGKAAAYYLLRDVYFEQVRAAQYLKLAEENARLAIGEDNGNAQAFAYLGLIYQAQYNWAAAASTFEIALALNPSDALINYWYGNVFRIMGKDEEALKYHAIANEQDPLYPVINAGYTYTCALTGRHQLAEQLLDEWQPVFERSFLHEMVRGYNLLLQEKYEQALPYLDRSLDYNPDFAVTRIGKIYCLGKLGRRSEVDAYIDTLQASQPNDQLRAVLAWLSIGEEEKAVESLRQAADMGRIDTDILQDPRYEPIIRHPIVLQVLREYRLYQYLPTIQ